MQKEKSRQISVHCILACLYFLLLPTAIAVVSVGNSILKVATVPIGLYFAVTLILSNRTLQINGVHLSLLFYTLLVVASLFQDADTIDMYYVTGYILNAALYICLTVIPYNERELDWLEKVQIILLIILNLLTLLSNGREDSRTTLVIMGQTSDPNYFVGFFIFPLAVTLKHMVSSKRWLFYLALIAVSVYSVFLSGSRGGLVAVAVTIAGFAAMYPSDSSKRFLFLVGGMLFLLILWVVFKPVLPEKIIDRMSIDAVIESGGTGRTVIWKSMLQEIVDQPEKLLFGRGMDSLHTTFLNGKLVEVAAHNHVIQAVYNQGLVGLISFFFLTGVSFFRCCRRRKTVSIAILGMLALSVSVSFNQTTRTFWNLIAYAALAFPDNNKSIENGGLSDNECN